MFKSFHNNEEMTINEIKKLAKSTNLSNKHMNKEFFHEAEKVINDETINNVTYYLFRKLFLLRWK